MKENEIVLLTHADLDGVGSEILLCNTLNIHKKYCAGYSKIKDHIDNGSLFGYGACIVSDISLTQDQYKSLTEHYGRNFIYIDHHKPTGGVIEDTIVDEEPRVIFSDKYSATALILNKFGKSIFEKRVNKNKDFKNEVFNFVSSIDAYDMWRYESHPKQFKAGYDLNILYWHYGHFNFFDRFFNMSLNYTEEEKNIIKDYKDKRNTVLEQSEKEIVGINSLFVLDTNISYVNDYTLFYPNHDLYFMLYSGRDGNMVLSIRSKMKGVDLGKVVKSTKVHSKYIKTAGGHPQSAGIDFYNNINFDDILDVVEFVLCQVEGAKEIPEIPF